MAGATTKTSIQAYFEANRRMLSEMDELSVTVLNTFLGVVLWGYDRKQDDPLTIYELSEKIGLPYTTVSRHLRYLGEGERMTRGPAPKLVERHIYPLNRRQKVVSLTSKGRALGEQLMFILERRNVGNADIPEA